MNLKELYQEIILDHGKNPRNLKTINDYNKDAKGHNPLCGDKVHIFLKLNDDFGIFSVEQSFTIKTVNSPSNMAILLSILFNNLKSDCQSL